MQPHLKVVFLAPPCEVSGFVSGFPKREVHSFSVADRAVFLGYNWCWWQESAWQLAFRGPDYFVLIPKDLIRCIEDCKTGKVVYGNKS